MKGLFNKYRKKSINFPLIIGSIIILLLFLVSIYPEYFSAADPYGVQRLTYTNEASGAQILVPPLPPSKDYPFGTDELGRDMKSLIVYGAKQTMMVACLVALFRLLIALPIAIFAAYRNRFASWLIKQFKVLFSAIPMVIAVILLSRIALFNDLIKNPTIQSSMWLILLGWSPFAHQLKQKVSEVLQQDFIEGEIAIGKNKLEIALQNVLPHIIPSIVVLLFLEVAMILLLMAQLGLFGLTFSGGYYTGEGSLAVPSEFDWASLLQFAYLLFGTDKMWLVFFPTVAFAISVIGFNLFGEGLRLEFDKRNSKVITYLKKVPAFFSPMNLIYEIKNYSIYKSTVLRKTIVYITILAIIFFPVLPSKYKLDTDGAMTTINELTQDKYAGRRTGTDGMRMASDYVAGKLKEYGVQPLYDSYLDEFDVKQNFNIKEGNIKFFAPDGKELNFEFRNDYEFYSTITRSERLEVMFITTETMEKVTYQYADALKGKLLLFDTRGLDRRDVTSVMMKLTHMVKPNCLILVESWHQREDFLKRNSFDKAFTDTVAISCSSEMGNELKKYSNLTAEYDVKVDVYKDRKGHNVIGYIPGSNPEYDDECIVIGSSLDYLGDDVNRRYPGALTAGAVALELEMARAFVENGIKPEKSIIFAFWDGNYTDYRGSMDFTTYINRKYDHVYYMDLSYFASKDSEKIMFDTSKSIPKSKESQGYIKSFRSSARGKDVPVLYGRITTAALQDFMGIGKESLVFGSDQVSQYLHTPEDRVENISKEKLNLYGQVILDTLIDTAKGAK